MKSSFTLFGLSVFLIVGCMDSLEEQTKKSPNSIIGKKTQDIGKFDPAVKQEVSDSKVKITNPITGPLQAYGPMLEQISKSHIDYAVKLYQAEHGRYPKDYDEFMSQIIKKNNIKLPVLPGNAKYQYDEENHKLVIVKVKANAANEDDEKTE